MPTNRKKRSSSTQVAPGVPTQPAPAAEPAAAKGKPSRILGGRLLDARRDRLDLRDRVYVPPLASLPPQFPSDAELAKYLRRYIDADLVLDQGHEGACTGFGLACVVNYLSWRAAGMPEKFEGVSPRMLYHLARLYDEWPGEDYEGSSCRGALKGWHKHGVCGASLWPYRDDRGNAVFVQPQEGWAEDALGRVLGVYYRVDVKSIVDMQAAIVNIGAVYASATVHEGWNVPTPNGKSEFANLPEIQPHPGTTTGGHAFALVGYNARGFVVQNSWGRAWGLEGFAVLTYEDWLENGQDCWATALGVGAGATERQLSGGPRGRVRQPHRAYVRTLASPLAAGPGQALLSNGGTGPADPALLSESQAYYRTVVLGNDGRPQLRVIEHENAVASAARLADAVPRAWLAENEARNLVVYAHGGLNSEDKSVSRIRLLGRVLEANGIYPLFLTWRTGPVETIGNIVEDELNRVLEPFGGLSDFADAVRERVSEQKDRFLEVAARSIVAKALWDQMKQNAQAASETGGGADIVSRALARLHADLGGRLRIHLVGHSAGSILLGHMLAELPPIATCTLMAPACTVGFANRLYAPALQQGTLARIRIDLLSDARERDDTVGPYGKSLLYLVSRALETSHTTPLLGLEAAFRTEWNESAVWNTEPAGEHTRRLEALASWQRTWAGLGDRGSLVVERRESIPVRADARGTATKFAKATHGSFDNHLEVINAVMADILGGPPPKPATSLDY